MLQAQIYINKDEFKGDQPLYKFIFQLLIQQGINGATAFRGTLGFGSNQHLNNPDKLFSFDDPTLLITFIDEDEKVKKLITELRNHVSSGLVVVHKVEKYV